MNDQEVDTVGWLKAYFQDLISNQSWSSKPRPYYVSEARARQLLDAGMPPHLFEIYDSLCAPIYGLTDSSMTEVQPEKIAGKTVQEWMAYLP